MRLTAGAHTDVGIRKTINQDAFGAQIVASGMNESCLLIACDGVGGMSEGEIASGVVVCSFLDWFNEHLAEIALDRLTEADVLTQWHQLVQDANSCILNYAQSKGVHIGTTATVFLTMLDRVFLMNIGDTRLYLANQGRLEQLTKDHTLVQQEVDRGTLTPEAARVDKRKNILIRCIGVEKTVTPDYYSSKLQPGCVYLLCTDGLRNVIDAQELYEGVCPERIECGEHPVDLLKKLVEIAKSRGERDNITAIMLYVDRSTDLSEQTVDLEDTLKLCFSKVRVQEDAKTLWRIWHENQRK